ncbi:ankyrin-3-like [Physella acuta]|uniref:ankyrin-3-like n=1 Tax=Physella acuta TaxID=109671 RepID=UPI0027DB3789|nr:ankyrin-3-like [Physella acuta]
MTHNINLIEVSKYGTNVAIIEFIKQAEDAGYTFYQDALDFSLIESCNRGLKTLDQFVVSLGANVNKKRENGDTPLHISAGKGFTDICRLLLAKGCDINALNDDGDTPLMAAVQPSGSIELIHLLLEQDNVDIDHKNKNGVTALMKAFEDGHKDVVNLLLNFGATLDGKAGSTGTETENANYKAGRLNNVHVTQLLSNVINDNTLIAAAIVNTIYLSHNSYGILVQLLASIKNGNRCVNKHVLQIFQTLIKCGFDVNWKSDSGETPLVLAVEIGSAELVEMLCSFGARLSDKEVTIAARQGRNDIISLLLYYGAPACGSALETALASEHIDTAQNLIQHGVVLDVAVSMTTAVIQCSKDALRFIATNYPNESKKIAEDTNRGLLHAAVKLGDVDIVNILLDLNADVNGVYDNKTPLLTANHETVIDLLVTRGAEVNYKDDDGMTALHHVVENNCFEKVKILVQNGADTNAQKLYGKAPLHLATLGGNIEIIQLLLQNDADPQLQDSDGDTPLIIAVRKAEKDPWNGQRAIEILIEASSDLIVRNRNGNCALHIAAHQACHEALRSLIDAKADLNITDKHSATALSLALDQLHILDYGFDCVSILLEHGATVQFVHPEMIHRLTSLGWSRVVQQLIQRGLPPSEIVFLKNSCGWPTSTPVTPFSVALLMENIELASFMLDVWYLTPSDVRTLSGQTSVTDSLRRKALFRSVNFLEKATVRLLTLEQLCFINLSTYIGTDATRMEQIDKMHLPNIFKNKLKFNTTQITLG